VLGILVLNSRVFVSLLCDKVTPVSHNNTQFIIVSVIFWNHNTSVGLNWEWWGVLYVEAVQQLDCAVLILNILVCVSNWCFPTDTRCLNCDS
jgi:hypothetical protein